MRCCRFFVAAFLAAATRVAGHPICTDDTPPVVDQALSYCPEQQAGVCCTDLDEAALETIVQEAGAISEECESYYKQVVCGRCHSFSGHLYARLWPPLPFLDGLTMKKDFCDELVAACTGQGTLEFPTYAEGSGTLTYCEKHAGTQADDIYWSYPFVEEPVFDPGLTLAFPDIPDEDKPAQTLTLKQSPDGSMFWLVGQVGKIISVDAGDSGASAATVIDLGPHNTPSLDVDPTGVFHVAAEEGLLDVAFDPLFDAGSGDAFYLSYTVKYDTENRPRNRLSKFLYYPGDPAATRASEEILLTTIQKISPIHASGWLDFKPSDFANPGPVGSAHDIYWSSGDGGKKVDQLNRGQDPTNMLGAIIRISVSGTDPGYTIPAGNVESGGNPDIKEEICAYGFRNPFRCGFDKVTDKLYCGDVGHFSVEEIDLIECGNNYGWKILEGDRCHTELEDVDCNDYSEPASRAGFTSPYFQYCHDDYDSSEAIEEVNLAGVDVCGDRQLTGRCVIGGYVYRGELFEDLLYGAYVFGDNETKNIHYLLEADDGTITVGNIISDGSIVVIGFAQTNNGEMMVIDLSYNIYHLPCGDLCEPSCLDKSENLPTFQSEGCFTEVASDRALPTQAPSCSNGQDAMTAEICASYCGTITGMEYMGLYAGSECSCGGSGADFGRHGTATTCDMPCTATPEETCGGVDAVEIFSLGEPVATPAPTASSGTPVPIPAGTPVPTPSADTPVPIPSGTPVPTPSAGTPVPIPSGTPVPTPSAGTPVPIPSGTPAPTPSATPTPIDQTTGYTYIDCFQDQKDDRIMTLGLKANVMNAEKCFGVCSSSPFFATQYGRECWCGSDDYDKHGTSTACTVDCNGTPGDEICGGSFAASVYSNNEFDPSATPSPVVPPGTPAPLEPLVFTSLGCFQDQRDDRIMIKGGQGNNMDSLVCAHTCVDSPFFATQYGSECWCGSTADYDKHGPSIGCTVECAGNPDEICGGSYAASVYGF